MADRSATALHSVLLTTILAAAAATGCELTGPATDTAPRYAVEAYLTAGAPLPRVRVMEIQTVRTGSSFDRFDAREAGVTGARVRVTRLSSSGSEEQSDDELAEHYPYEAHPSIPGVYVSEDSARIAPLGSYRLHVQVPGTERPITARTRVPDTFRVLVNAPDTLTYRSGPYLPLPVSTSRYPGRGPIYQLTSTVPDPALENLTPAGDSLVANSRSLADHAGAVDEGYTVGSLAGNEWPLTRAASYPRPDGRTIRITYPWRAVLFYGPNRIAVYAVGDNLYDYIRSISTQKQSAGPGGFTSIIDHVNGGTGVFGGLATAEHQVFVRRPTN